VRQQSHSEMGGFFVLDTLGMWEFGNLGIWKFENELI